MSLTNVIVTGDDFEKTLQISAVIEEFLVDQGFADVQRVTAAGDTYRNEVPSLLEHIRQHDPQFLTQPLRIHPIRYTDEDARPSEVSNSGAYRTYDFGPPRIIIDIEEPEVFPDLPPHFAHSVIVTDA